MIQTLELVDYRWSALLSGEKLDTIRLNEGEIKPGLLKYINCDFPEKCAFVWVTNVQKICLKNVPNEPNKEAFLQRMQNFYPKITLDTKIDFIEHLSVSETMRLHADAIRTA